jgi:hypothetical protein
MLLSATPARGEGARALDTKEQGQDALATRPRNNGPAPFASFGLAFCQIVTTMTAVTGGPMDTEERLPVPNGVTPFEGIRRTNAVGGKYWSSRDFAQVLSYSDHHNFEQAMKKAKTACFKGGQRVEDHFVGVTEMPPIGGGANARNTIQELGGSMPENLPPAESMRKLEPRRRQQPEAFGA